MAWVKVNILVLAIVAFSVVTYIMQVMQNVESSTSIGNIFDIRRDDDDSGIRGSTTQINIQQTTETEWEPFNNTNPFIDSFCPKATCLNSPLCQPCNRRHFIIISTARSGSTTLLRQFDQLPNIRLSGENHNQMKFTSQLTNNLLNNRPNLLKHPMDKTSGPFAHNTIPKGSMGCIAQQMMHVLNPPPLEVQKDKSINVQDYDKDLILGFKTVRFHDAGWDDALEASKYLKDHFPCSKVLINLQTNITHQYTSFKETFNHTEGTEYLGPSMKRLKEVNDFQRSLMANLGGPMAKLIDMDNWAKDVRILNEVVVWLGYQNCEFDNIVHENLAGYTRDEETELHLGKNCLFPL